MKNTFEIRIIRSPWSDFYGREIEDATKSYPDWYLKEIKNMGFNGIWLHALLRELVSSKPFPEFGNKEKIYHLKKIVEKADKYGIKVFLYLCEPRSFKAEDKFWEKHPDVKGQPFQHSAPTEFSGVYYALCSSTQKVKDYLYESSYNLFKKVDGLGGVFLITASEFHTHCYSHYPKWKKEVKNFPEMIDWAKYGFYCKRCEERAPYEVVAEIITLINKGVKEANKKAEVIAWAWSWNIIEPEPQKNLISLLPKDVILMSDWERGGYKIINGKRYPVDEYSLSYIGPSPRFKKRIYLARKKGMKVMAKLQIGTTHELVTIPYTPVAFNVAEKLDRMRKLKINGFLSCWIFGGDISPITRIAGKFINSEKSKTEIIKEVAISEFGVKSADKVIKAWKIFSSAWKKYPFNVPFIYVGPINYATVYPLSLKAKKKGPIASWRPLPRDKNGHLDVGDNLDEWTGPFTPEELIECFENMANEWKNGIDILEKTWKEDKENKNLLKELDLAKHIYLTLRSVINIIKFYVNLRKYNEKKSKTVQRNILKIMKEELEITISDRKIIKRNKDFGYHAESFTNFLPLTDFDYKINLLKKQIKKLS